MNSYPVARFGRTACLRTSSAMSCSGSQPRSRAVRRRGFTLIEVIVAAAIVAILSAVAFPVVTEQIERRRVDNAITTLKTLADAATAFRVNVGMNPGRLVHLSAPITGSDLNSCGAVYGIPAANSWAGPYYTKQILIETGLPLSEDNLGRVQNVFVRTPVGAATPGTLALQVTGIPLEKVTEIDAAVDGDGGVTTGRVRWTTPADANGHVTMSYHVAINGC